MKNAFSNFRLPPRSAVGGRRGERGVALVITLILLSVTLVMAVAFLALSRREREANATTTDATQARLAAESALAAAQAQIIANIYATNAAALNFGLMVSTNFINPDGYNPNGVANPLDVSYVNSAGVPLTGINLASNIANLQILPRAPVFVPVSGGDDFRFYLDLNRNGQFDTNGVVGVFTNLNGNPNGPAVYSHQDTIAVGDPEWVGVLEHPDQFHSPVNKFVSRYAFVAMPVGNTLDANAIGNQAGTRALNALDDGYMRNQGVGSWELNLAAFLADLNTNIWSPFLPANNNGYYAYNGWNYTANQGVAFDDARGFLNYRYNGTYSSLLPATATLNNSLLNVANDFPYDNIDEYGDGPVQLGLAAINERNPANPPPVDGDKTPGATPWAGSDNVNHFFSLPDDLFDSTKLSANFINRLTSAGTNADTYDRYTFYRLLAQLGTDSSAESGKLNLNYINVATNTGSVIPGMETNMVRWPNGLTFFTNAADRMLKLYTTNWFQKNPANFIASYYGVVLTNYISADGYGVTNIPYLGVINQVPAFGIANIPVYVNGRFVYSPAINRILQLAANIYDASTNDAYPNPAFYPSVFRPLLYKTNGVVFISGYQQVLTFNPSNTNPPVDISIILNGPNGSYTNSNIYGIPWIVGAKKYLPSFNQLSMFNQVQVTRKLQYIRPTTTSTLSTYTTNQCYVIGVSNAIGVNYWNPYQNNYPGTVTIYSVDSVKMTLNAGPNTYGGVVQLFPWQQTIPNWSGSAWSYSLSPADRIPLQSSFTNYAVDYSFIPPANFFPSTSTFGSGTTNFDAGPVIQLPALQLSTTNWFYSVVYDTANNRIVDYVQLEGPLDSTNLNTALADVYPAGIGNNNNNDYFMWATNVDSNGSIHGVGQQFYVSQGGTPPNSTFWNFTLPNFPQGGGISAQQTYFRNFFSPGNEGNTDLSIQAPYTPTRTLFCPYLLQVNDPLVHYLVTDLNGVPGDTAFWYNGAFVNGIWAKNDGIPQSLPVAPVVTKGARFQPWGQNKQIGSLNSVDTNAFNSTFKDALVWEPDFWDFPTNVYPTVGWLGRVHRGTPWQTVYLKASDILTDTNSISGSGTIYTGTNTWDAWTGDLDSFDAADEAPLQDRLLFDIFTTKLNDNATRGTLSVNQPNFAAWSALFSGMIAITNTIFIPPLVYQAPPNNIVTAPFVINPAGVEGQNSALWDIYNSINYYRTNAALFPLGGFTHVGDVLTAPALTEQSPFINYSIVTNGYAQSKYGVSDEVMEWLPQQMMSLLRVSDTPRYVIYGYGQALRPAANGLYTAGSGSLFNLVTNYQVMAETGIRAVVQVHPQVINTTNGYVTNYTTTVESYNVLAPQ